VTLIATLGTAQTLVIITAGIDLSVGAIMVLSSIVMGKLAVDAISARDYPVLQAFILLMTVVYVLSNLVVDLLVAAVDPRVRLERPA